jgi:hypothetical protein
VGEHVDVRVGPVDELAVLPDLLDLGDRHLGASSERVVVLVRLIGPWGLGPVATG